VFRVIIFVSWLVVIPNLVNAILVLAQPMRRSLNDFAAGSIVVKR